MGQVWGPMQKVPGVALGWRAGSGVGAADHNPHEGRGPSNSSLCLWAWNTQRAFIEHLLCTGNRAGDRNDKMQGNGRCGVVGRLEPGWSGKVPSQRHPRRKSRMVRRSQSRDSQERTFQEEGTESSEGLRWEGREGVKKSREAGSFASLLMPGRALSSA